MIDVVLSFSGLQASLGDGAGYAGPRPVAGPAGQPPRFPPGPPGARRGPRAASADRELELPDEAWEGLAPPAAEEAEAPF